MIYHYHFPVLSQIFQKFVSEGVGREKEGGGAGRGGDLEFRKLLSPKLVIFVAISLLFCYKKRQILRIKKRPMSTLVCITESTPYLLILKNGLDLTITIKYNRAELNHKFETIIR